MNGNAEATVAAEREPAVLAAIHAACFGDARSADAGSADTWSADALAALLASPGCFALVAGPADAPAGYPPASMILARVAGGDCEILTIGVRPQYRRHGLAILLLEHAGIRAAGLGATRQVLEVATGNAPALRLYARLGFAECGTRPGYYGTGMGGGRDAVILARDLGSSDRSR